MAKQVSPGVLALRKVVDDVHKEAREDAIPLCGVTTSK